MDTTVRETHISETLNDKCSGSPTPYVPESSTASEEECATDMDTEHTQPAEQATTHFSAPDQTTAASEGAQEDEAHLIQASTYDTLLTDSSEQCLRRRAGNSGASPDNDSIQTTATADNDNTQATTTAREDKGKAPADKDSADAAVNSGRAAEASDEFSCNICFDTASEPVLTICGHLFCWSCLVQWLERSATCPVCKAGCDKEKVIPVYGRGKQGKDPRRNESTPNRPQGRRPPPPLPRQPNQFFGFDPFGVPGSFHSVGMGRGGGAVFVGGFGFLPALMGLSAFAGAQTGNAQPGGQPVGRQAFASRILMMVAAMILMSIIFY
ncbi:hypothetical protein IW136_002437 [Coemansia sp. RSA 678]|nr:hypothetical protein IW136_002437 [Coemansia sp. RSA 678]